jgi:hypothetical protein
VEARRPEKLDILGEALPTTRLTERCENPEHAATNTLWLGTEDVIWKSR